MRRVGALPHLRQTRGDFQEAVRWARKSEDLSIEIARVQRELFEAVGSAHWLFPHSEEKAALLDAVYHHKCPVVVRPTSITVLADLDKWKDAVIPALQKIVTQEIETPIENLIRHLSRFMDAPVGGPA